MRANGTMALALERAGIATTKIRSYSEALRAECDRLANFSVKEITTQSGLSTAAVNDILGNRRPPTRREHKSLCRALPRLKHLNLEEFFLEQTPVVVAAAPPPTQAAPPASKERRIVRAPTVVRVDPPKVVRAPDPPRLPTPAATVSSEPIRPSPLVVQTKTAEQFSVIEEIDPSLASLLLEGNVRNRSLSRHLVDAMARDMRDGRWQLTHQGIALDSDYRLLDGQHRLHAIVKSGATVRMTVTYNVKPDAFSVVDVGGRPRSIADVFYLKHGGKHSALTVATLRILGGLGLETMSSIVRVTPPEIEALHVKFGAEIGWACSVIAPKRSVGPWATAPFVAAIAYAYPTAKAEVASFAETILSETAAKTKTMAALRRYLESHGHASYTERVDAAYVCFRALDAHLRGVDLERVYLQTKGGSPGEGRSAGKEKEYRSFRAKRARMGLSE